jgi:hypothetical protein
MDGPVRPQGIGGARSGRASGGTPGKPEFFAEQKMRPKEAVNKSPISVSNLQVEARYLLILLHKCHIKMSLFQNSSHALKQAHFLTKYKKTGKKYGFSRTE